MAAVLFVVTGSSHWTLTDGTLHPTGFWAEELAEPHRVFREAGHRVTIATPGGVPAPVDAGSLAPEANGGAERADALAAYLESIRADLEQPEKLAEVALDDYDAVFYPGGHGPMEDLAADPHSGRLLTETIESGRPLGVLCHGPAALLAARGDDGAWPFAGHRMTAFTNAEETAAGLAGKAPWLLQDRLAELGADFVEGPPFQPHTVSHYNLFTGQNPASSEQVARNVIAALGS